MQVGKFFPVGMFLLNLHTICYGNQTSNYFETESMLMQTSVEEYIGLADAFNEN